MTHIALHAQHEDRNSHVTHSTHRGSISTTTTPYKRAYKACESCRRTKAKCELEPSATSCSKCLREQKECIFPPQRSTKRAKISSESNRLNDANQSVGSRNAQEQEPSKLRSRTSNAAPGAQHENSSKTKHLSRQGSFISNVQQRGNKLTTPPIDMTADGIPGQHQKDMEMQDQARQASLSPDKDPVASANLQRDVMQTFVTSSKDAMGLLFRAAEQIDSEDSDEQQQEPDLPHDGSAAAGSIYNIHSPSMPSPGLASTETLDLWDQHRFVRQGWFTAREAVSYIEFFFRNLSPLSPVADSYYADHKNHKRLILEDPLLCCTILMISSRHHIPTPSSIASRADFVHMRLWRHVEHLIQKITFGAEKYSIGKTRTLGSIQALLLIIEWHPRALHFPPETDGWDSSLAPSADDSFLPRSRKSDAGTRWREDVFEPAKRSDRMSWMLVGIATTLAHELGVFDHPEDDDSNQQTNTRRKTLLQTRRLLYLYTSQLSLRLGCTNIFPHGNHQISAQITEPNDGQQEQTNVDRDTMTSKWIEITKLLITATEMFFANPSATRQMLRNSRYVSLLDHFQPLLSRWHSDFMSMACPTVAEPARQILLVEYHYVRMYINSVAMQALVERASSYNSGDIWLDQDFLRSEFAPDFRFVREVRDASTSILAIATKLADDKILQYCPVRLFLRIVSASIFLLKTISLGSREIDVVKSLGQLERCIEALQNSRADDIHLSSRYAMLIARHVKRFKRNFRIKRTEGQAPGTPRMNESSLQPTNISSNSNMFQAGAQDEPASSSEQPYLVDLSNDAFGEKPGQLFDFDNDGSMQDWLAQPFNSQVAPFGTDWLQPSTGLAMDSLDFLWNMST